MIMLKGLILIVVSAITIAAIVVKEFKRTKPAPTLPTAATPYEDEEEW